MLEVLLLVIAGGAMSIARDWLAIDWGRASVAWSLLAIAAGVAVGASVTLVRRWRTGKPAPAPATFVLLLALGVVWLHGEPGRYLWTRTGTRGAMWAWTGVGWTVLFGTASALAGRAGGRGLWAKGAALLWSTYLGLDWGVGAMYANRLPVFPHDYHHITKRDAGRSFVTDPDADLLRDLRGRSFSRVPAAEEMRVVLLGGSSAWGHGMTTADDADLGPQIVQALGETNRTGSCIVAAYPGFNSFHELQMLTAFALEYKPDWVIAVTGWNDFHRYSHDHRTGEYYTEHQMRFGLAHPLFFALIDTALPRQVVAKTRLLGGANFAPHNRTWTPTHEANLRAFIRNERRMARLCRAENIGFLCALQPPLIFKPTRTPAEATALGTLPLEVQTVQSHAYVQAQRALEVALADSGAVIVDLARMWNDESEARFIDPAHWTATGHAEVARVLVERLTAEPQVALAAEGATAEGAPPPAASQ